MQPPLLHLPPPSPLPPPEKTKIAASYILDFVLQRSLNQNKMKWNCFALIRCLSINFKLKNTFYVNCVGKSPCTKI